MEERVDIQCNITVHTYQSKSKGKGKYGSRPYNVKGTEKEKGYTSQYEYQSKSKGKGKYGSRPYNVKGKGKGSYRSYNNTYGRPNSGR
eukprot:6135235-Amphidinium_carterae.11